VYSRSATRFSRAAALNSSSDLRKMLIAYSAYSWSSLSSLAERGTTYLAILSYAVSNSFVLPLGTTGKTVQMYSESTTCLSCTMSASPGP
jgi:hypothetical protein